MEGTQKESGLRLRRAASTVLIAAIALVSHQAKGQGRPEARVDGIFSETPAVHLGAGVLFPLGTYVRSGVVGGVGVSGSQVSFRGDFVNIFHVDPFRESRWAPYGGGGFSLRRDKETNTYLLLVLGLEGPRGKAYAPAFEIGLGGGVRAGVIVRRSGGQNR